MIVGKIHQRDPIRFDTLVPKARRPLTRVQVRGLYRSRFHLHQRATSTYLEGKVILRPKREPKQKYPNRRRYRRITFTWIEQYSTPVSSFFRGWLDAIRADWSAVPESPTDSFVPFTNSDFSELDEFGPGPMQITFPGVNEYYGTTKPTLH